MTTRIIRTPALRRAELLHDLKAAGAAKSDAWITQPGILRRVAVEVAKLIPSDARSVVGVGRMGESLAVAVSLTTGLPITDAITRTAAVVAVRPWRIATIESSARISAFAEGDAVGWLCALEETSGAVPLEVPHLAAIEAARAIRRVKVDDGVESWIDLRLDPNAARIIADYVAAGFRLHGVDTVMSWSKEEDIAFARLISDRTRCERIAVGSLENGLAPSISLVGRRRVGWVTLDDRQGPSPSAAQVLVDEAGSSIVATANLFELSAL